MEEVQLHLNKKRAPESRDVFDEHPPGTVFSLPFDPSMLTADERQRAQNVQSTEFQTVAKR